MAKQISTEGTKKSAVVLAMEGNLGSGKTTFIQGFAKGLGVKGKITSPTFVIIRKYEIFNFRTPPLRDEAFDKASLHFAPRPFGDSAFKNFYHIDCYRLEKPKELIDLGFKEIIKRPENVVAIEWPERIEKIMPRKRISMKFKILGKKERKMTIMW